MVSRQLALKSSAKLSTAKSSSPQTRCNKCSTGYSSLIGYIDGLIAYLFFFQFQAVVILLAFKNPSTFNLATRLTLIYFKNIRLGVLGNLWMITLSVLSSLNSRGDNLPNTYI